MKKVLVSLLVVLLVLTGCAQDTKGINYLTPDELMTKIDNDDTFFLVVGVSTCAGCLAYKPVLEELVKNKGAELYYIQTDTEAAKSKENEEKVIKVFEQYLDNKVTQTPTTIFFRDGEMDRMEVGGQKYTDLITWFEAENKLGQ